MPKVKSETYYSPAQIAEQGLFPWIKYEKSIILWIKKQIELGNKKKYGLIQKFPLDNDGPNAKHGIRYFVTQTGLSKIQADFEDGSLFDGR